ncbi:MAG: acylphosphatase [Candidatus Aenigmarchaeota archaeon]|nr:acylphosphatase [Candidatus Aenigmarchaeota archaeon]
MEKRYRVVVYGRVQGVMFRHNVAKIAEKANIKGWVRNNPDGTVEAVFEGKEETLEKVLNWCRKGPIGSKIEKVEVKEEEFKDEFEAFYITA